MLWVDVTAKFYFQGRLKVTKASGQLLRCSMVLSIFYETSTFVIEFVNKKQSCIFCTENDLKRH